MATRIIFSEGGILEPKSDIQLKINFIEGNGSPARVFEIAAGLIRSFEDLDRVLVSSVSSTISTSLILEDVEKSSLKVFLKNILKQLDDDALKTLDWKPLVGQYLVKAKHIALEWLDRDINQGEEAGIEDLAARLQTLASETEVLHLPDYAPINPTRLAQPLDEIQQTKRMFREGESMTITLDKTEYDVKITSNWLPSQHMKEVGGDKVLSNLTKQLLIIRKPDLLGKSKWQFLIGKKKFSAPIEDQDWLKEFHQGAHPLSPGDALLVQVRTTARYDAKGKLIEKNETIERVLEVIKNDEPPSDLFN